MLTSCWSAIVFSGPPNFPIIHADMYVHICVHVHMQEGFASESRFDWLVRLYFLSFNIITLVIFEVAIAFLVEAFVYKVLARQRHRICCKHKQAFKKCQCPEGELLHFLLPLFPRNVIILCVVTVVVLWNSDDLDLVVVCLVMVVTIAAKWRPRTAYTAS